MCGWVLEWTLPRTHWQISDVQRAKRMYLFTFKQIVPRLIEQDDVIIYEGVLKMDLALGAGMVCAGPECTQNILKLVDFVLVSELI